MHPESVRQRAIALYESGLSCRTAAKRVNLELGIIITPQTVARWARNIGKNRPVGDRRTVELPKQAVRLCESGRTLKEVAQTFQVSPTTVRKRFGETGIDVRPKALKYGRLADRAWLDAQYRKRGLSARDIAQGIGCSAFTVHYHLRRHGIPRKRRRQART